MHGERIKIKKKKKEKSQFAGNRNLYLNKNGTYRVM
jgi:hypothetical protein